MLLNFVLFVTFVVSPLFFVRGPLKHSTVAQETNPISRSFRRNQESDCRI